jgi:predicted DNA-binding mobile mystery protein A
MMNSEFKHLRISQLDRSLKATRSIPPRPADGWIAALREALGLTLADLGRRVHMTKQSIQQFERTEANDRITLGNLRLMAEAMGCNLVYTFVPKTGSLADLARQSARAGATRDLGRVVHTMALEDQRPENVGQLVEDETQRRLKTR